MFPAAICAQCHASYSTNAPVDSWRQSMMGQAARDPVWHAAMAIAEQDAGAGGDLCIRCHSPSGWVEGRSVPTDGSALTGPDYDGVTCHTCHRMVDPIYEPGVSPGVDLAILNPANLGGMVPTEPHGGTYVLDPLDRRRGPFDLGGAGPHPWLESPFHQESLLCATCHDVSNPVFDRVGGSTPAASDTYVPNEMDEPHPTQDKYDMFPIERTFSEWAQSAFAAGPIEMEGRFGGNKTAVSSCQDCHMPDTTDRGCSLGGPIRQDMPPHFFAGANTWVMQSVLNLDESNLLWLTFEESSLTQQEVDDAIARNVDMLTRAADLKVTRDEDRLNVRVVNQTGHKLPTGYPEGRRMWLNVRVFDELDQIVAEYGHYDFATATLTTHDTEVYECKLGLDANMAAATGLPAGVSFHFVLNNQIYKDNRIPPRGFTNAGFESVQAGPVGASYADGQYWDDTVFDLPCDATRAEVRLYYQTTSREYIEFLRDENTTTDRGDIAYDEWVASGKSAPALMGTAAIDLDCNGNGVLDHCDILAGTSVDGDGNGVPDECQHRRTPPKKERGPQ